MTGLRAAGVSWGDIADRLGVTERTAHQRWDTTAEAESIGGAR